MTPDSQKLYKIAFRLAVFTIVYNLLEGLVAMFFGYADESLTLFGFGVDSFIEVISGLGIAHMVLRVQRDPDGPRDGFERTALKVTGYSFYALVLGLLMSSVHNIVTGQKPEATLIGVIISVISIAVMLGLIWGKMKVGRALHSDAIIADAQCTKVCVYMSVVLLIASAAYELTGIAYVDILGSLGLAYLSFNEGRECFEKAKSDKLCSCEDENLTREARPEVPTVTDLK
jgi:divalent metal cation (Fe/Co/Zn/Cd) transporter